MYLLSERISSEVIQISQSSPYFVYKINFTGEPLSLKEYLCVGNFTFCIFR
jgi:hypothetical protein